MAKRSGRVEPKTTDVLPPTQPPNTTAGARRSPRTVPTDGNNDNGNADEASKLAALLLSDSSDDDLDYTTFVKRGREHEKDSVTPRKGENKKKNKQVVFKGGDGSENEDEDTPPAMQTSPVLLDLTSAEKGKKNPVETDDSPTTLPPARLEARFQAGTNENDEVEEIEGATESPEVLDRDQNVPTSSPTRTYASTAAAGTVEGTAPTFRPANDILKSCRYTARVLVPSSEAEPVKYLMSKIINFLRISRSKQAPKLLLPTGITTITREPTMRPRKFPKVIKVYQSLSCLVPTPSLQKVVSPPCGCLSTLPVHAPTNSNILSPRLAHAFLRPCLIHLALP